MRESESWWVGAMSIILRSIYFGGSLQKKIVIYLVHYHEHQQRLTTVIASQAITVSPILIVSSLVAAA